MNDEWDDNICPEHWCGLIDGMCPDCYDIERRLEDHDD